MTREQKRKVTTLIRTARRNNRKMAKIKGEKSPFVASAAKYYPALKRLAEK